MAMKAETVLDFVELQLAPPRTRCELFVSANGLTEKLASGFLKPFLTHVRAVEEQVARGCSSVRLGHPHSLNGKSWFTKGTLERFVRFVSTPEVLERVKSVEDELAQLKQVRSIQASSLSQAEDILGGPVEDTTRLDNVHLKVSEKKGSCKLQRRNDGVVDRAEASKVELLRAMDLRLLALQQEQSSAFERAVAAGFTGENMADVVAFSDHFGADRLRTACVNFLDVLKTRDGNFTQLDSKAVPNFSSILLHGVPGADEKLCRHFDGDTKEASHAFEDERVEYGESALTSVIKETSLNNLSSRGSGGIEVRRRWGPPENIRTELFLGRNESDSVCSSESSNGASVRGSPEVQSLLKKNSIEQDMNQNSNPLHSSSTKNMSAAQGGNALAAGCMNSDSTHKPDDQADGEFLSTERRSSMPLPNVPNGNFSSQEALIKEKNRAVDLSSKSGEGSEALSAPVAALTRRLSVQDAISLFEKKQRRDSLDSVGKPRNGKQENGRASLDGAGASLSGSVVLKRWDSGKSLEAEENGSSFKPEVGGVLGTSFASASRLEVSGGFPNDSLQGRHGGSLSESVSGGLARASNKPSTQCVPAKIEATSNEQPAWSETGNEVCDGDWRKQFKLQLEKSLAQDCFRRDLLAEGDLAKHELGINISKKTLNYSRIDVGKDIGPSAAIPFVGSRTVEAAENGVLVESRQLPLCLNRGQNVSESSELCLPSFKRPTDVKVKKDGDTLPSESATKQTDNRESLGSSLVSALDHDMHALFILTDNQTDEEDKGSDGSKGRLYEQYRKLRDAKLMEDQDSKRAEREAKLRMMEETLRRRKAEMDARAVRLSKNGRNQARSSKVEVLESDLHTPKKEQQDGDVDATKSVGKDQAKSTISSISPPSTPCTSKEVSTLKPQGGRKAGAVPQKGATPPRSAGRTISSVSPKVTPRSTATGAVHKAMASSRGDNPLARSVPCFANLRKENTKPLPGRQQCSARVHPKNGATGRDTPPLEANSNVPVRTNFSRSGPSKEEQRSRSALLRKSYATVNDFKILSTSSDDGVLAPRKGQKEMTAEPPAYTKLRRSTAGSLQEAKPFLRKGRGIGPGTGPGVMKQKVSSTNADTTKSPDEEVVAAQRPEVSNTDGASQGADAVIDGGISKELSESENMDVEDDGPETFVCSNHPHVQAIRTRDSSQNDDEDGSTAVVTPTKEPLLGTWDDTQRASCTISSPIDTEAHNRFADVLSPQSDSNMTFDPDAWSLKDEDIEPLPQHDDDTARSIQNQHDEASGCGSFRAASPPHEHSLPVSSPVPPPPPSSSVVHQEKLSPTFAAKLESPIGSPATWISSQVQHTDVTQFDKKWVVFQKPVIASQPKESVKGFKRLLKFGRKSRSSEISAADCISASTTSEGDDEAEEQSRFVDEVSCKIRLSERRYNDLLGNHNQAEGEVAAQSLRSSIPTPPANFKMRDDHMGGGTLLKAPRSFFSLSSFRSKGSEAKSRSRDYGHA